MTCEFRASGRVNLIGDHTDYNEGFALPLAIDRECVVRARARDDDEVLVYWRDGADDLSDSYVDGVVKALATRGRPSRGVEAEVTSTVPIGAGLSSSAALEVALALALCSASDFALPPVELALACQEAELIATGVPCGIMDQLTAVSGRSCHALLIDCRTLSVESIPIPSEVAIVAIHSGVRRALADSAYAERRAHCEGVAASLGLRALRDASADQVAHDPRARHVVSENARVLAAADAMRAHDLAALGRLFSESHASLRDDYEVSTPELDLLVTKLDAAGALGARSTGAGFGGCVCAVVERERAFDVAERAAARYRDETGLAPTTFVWQYGRGE